MLRTTAQSLIWILMAFVALAEVQAGPYFRTGKVYFSRRNYPKALEYFQKDTQASPGNGDAFFYIGYIHEREGRSLEAVRNFQRAVELRMDKDLRLKAYWKIVLHYKYRRDWTNLATYCRKFLAFRNLEPIRKMLEEAEQHYSPEQKRVTDLLLQAEGLLAAGKAADAVAPLESVIATFPDHRRALWNLSQAHIKLGNYARAAGPLERLVAANDAVWQYHYRLGLCRFRLGQPERALESFRSAEKLNDEGSAESRHFIQLRIADAELLMNRVPEAAAALERATKIRTSHEASARLAYLAWRKGDHAQAVRLAQGQAASSEIGILVRFMEAVRRKNMVSATKLEAELRSKEDAGDWLPPGSSLSRILLLDVVLSKSNNWKVATDVAERLRVGTGVAEARLFARDPAAIERMYRERYAQALVETGRASEALRVVESEQSAEGQYQRARALAATSSDAEAVTLLKELFESRPELRKRARADTQLSALAERSQSLREMLADGGSAPR